MRTSIIRPKRAQKSPLERLLALTTVRSHNECWTWNGSKSKDGYGQFILEARRDRPRVRVAPYRYLWEVHNGRKFPTGKEPDHLCNNRSCVNPGHIEPVTHSENQKRSFARGRKRPGVDYVVRVKPTHCPRGHEYTVENSIRGGVGLLQCRTCDRLRHRRIRLAKLGVIVSLEDLMAEEAEAGATA